MASLRPTGDKKTDVILVPLIDTPIAGNCSKTTRCIILDNIA